MKIAIVAKLWEEVSPFSRGGTGSSLGFLVNGLVERGHQITLFATGNSKTKAQRLVSVRELPYRGDYSEIHEYENIANAFREHKNFDIIHCAVEQKSVLFGGLVDTPSLHSIRYGEFFEHELELLKKYKDLDFVGNSKGLKRVLPFLNWKGTIYNGLDVDRFSYQKDPEDYLLYLARLSPAKGVDIAIDVAREANRKLFIAGKMSETDRDFLDKKVLPFIDGENVIYLGEIGDKKKVKVLSEAYALLQPASTKIFEACSNTILEAMASGVPVIATDSGSNKELIKEGRTGFVVKTKKQMVKAVDKVKKIDRKECLKRAKRYFSLDKMVSEYESLYKKMIKK